MTDCRQRGLYVLDQLKVPEVAASSVDLSSFRLVTRLLIFTYGILILVMFRHLVYSI